MKSSPFEKPFAHQRDSHDLPNVREPQHQISLATTHVDASVASAPTPSSSRLKDNKSPTAVRLSTAAAAAVAGEGAGIYIVL